MLFFFVYNVLTIGLMLPKQPGRGAAGVARRAPNPEGLNAPEKINELNK